MSRYDGLIIPRSYSEYINKTDAATLSQALQLGGVLDSAPTEDSVKAVKSGGVFDALAGKQPTLTFDNVPTEDSDNPVKSGGIFDALATKQDMLTFDDAPTADSNNPVKSGGINQAIQDVSYQYDTEIGTYTLNSQEAKSIEITSFVHTMSNDYAKFTHCYSSGQNYIITSVNFTTGGKVWATFKNLHTTQLTTTIRLFELFVKRNPPAPSV